MGKPITKKQRDGIIAHLKADPESTNTAIAKLFGVTHRTVYNYRAKLGLAEVPSRSCDQGCYLPTPEEIEAHCRVFRERDRPENRRKELRLPEYGSICGAKKSRIFERVY